MTKELKDGKEFFDGEAVDIYEGRFSGGFLLEEAQGAPMSNGDLVTFIVTARVDTPKFTYVRKTGDLKRSNAMKVVAVLAVDSDQAKFLYDNMGLSVDGINEGLIEVVPPPVEASEVGPELFVDNFFANGSELTVDNDTKVVVHEHE
jgi:hypothetical protein